MLEKKIVAPEHRSGLGFYAGAAAKKGYWVKLNGTFSTGEAATHAGSNTPGWARSGDLKFSIAGTLNSGGTIGVVDKLEFQPESSDLALDTIASGEGVIVYFGGWFETDQYDISIAASTAGTLLYTNASGKLTATAGTGAPPVARLWTNKGMTYDSNYAATGMILFEILPNPWAGSAYSGASI